MSTSQEITELETAISIVCSDIVQTQVEINELNVRLKISKELKYEYEHKLSLFKDALDNAKSIHADYTKTTAK